VLLQKRAEVYGRELAFADDHAPVDDAVGHIHRRAEHQRSHRIVQAAGKGELVQAKGDEVRGHARRERADVVAAQHARPADGGQLQRLARGHRVRAVADPLQQHGSPRFVQQMAGVVRR
jgi:hypothetical protein